VIEEIHSPESFDGSEGLLAIVIRQDYTSFRNTTFLTHPSASQQVALIGKERGEFIPAHIHREYSRKVTITQEVLIVRKGKVRVTLYTSDRRPVRNVELHVGDTIVLLSGGHGFEFLEATELIEIKQGPYIASMDKIPIR
jgi:hypothetical protein